MATLTAQIDVDSALRTPKELVGDVSRSLQPGDSEMPLKLCLSHACSSFLLSFMMVTCSVRSSSRGLARLPRPRGLDLDFDQRYSGYSALLLPPLGPDASTTLIPAPSIPLCPPLSHTLPLGSHVHYYDLVCMAIAELFSRFPLSVYQS